MIYKKRIAVITHGGIGVGHQSQGMPVLMQLVKRLAMKYDVTVYSLHQYNTGFIAPNYQIKTVPFHHTTNLYVRMGWLLLIIFKDHLLRSFDLFQGFWGFPGGVLAAILGKLTGKPIITTFKGAEVVSLPEIGYGLLTSKRMKWLLNKVSKQSNCLIAQSNYYAEKIKSSGLKYKEIQVISGGIDRSLLKPILKKKPTIPYQFLHVANLNLVKNQATLLKAFKIISQKIDCYLHIAGHDTLNGKIQQLAIEMGIAHKVNFYGMLTQKELQDLFAKADIFLLTSLSESQGMVVNEAMASSCIVCGTRVGLIADLENKATLAVDVKDAESLARKVLTLLKDDAQFQSLQQFGMAWANEHDIEWTTKQYSILYDRFMQ